MTAYLDASALVPLIVKEQGSRAAAEFVSDHDGNLIISDFASAEVASAVSRLVRARELDVQRAIAALADFDRFRSEVVIPAQLTTGDVQRAEALVRQFELELRAPDAIHLVMSSRLEAPLVTLDRKLARAARALNIAVTELGLVSR